MRVSAMVDGELMGFEGDAAKVIKARDDEIGVLRHVIEALEGVMAERKPVAISRECKWVQDDDSVERYDTYCGQSWEFNDGGVEQNGMNYCHSCGGKIVEIQSMEGVWV